MAVEKTLRGDGDLLGVIGIGRHPGMQAGSRQSDVSQMPMKPSRLASASDVSPDDQTSPGVNGAG
jgi:hypothetical protein